MNPQKNNIIINELKSFLQKLEGEVVVSFNKNSSFGKERFGSWKKQFIKFLNKHLPDETPILNSKLEHSAFFSYSGEPDLEHFWRQDGENMVSYIQSLILDIENDVYDFSKIENTDLTKSNSKENITKNINSVFIVHGHDGEVKERTARFIERLGLTPIILHEQANKGLTIIEKIEKYSNVGFAIILYTSDDLGNVKSEAKNNNLNSRTRQNVIFEHGYLIGKIGRENVIPLVCDKSIELPSDISGMVYISEQRWEIDIANEIESAGYKIDRNDIK